MVARLERRRWTLRTAHRAAGHEVDARETLLLRIEHGELVGWGEAAPLPDYDGGDLESCAEALGQALVSIGECEPRDPDRSIAELGKGLPPQARAALDTALRDVAARADGQPLWRALGGVQGGPIQASALLSANTGPECARSATDARRRGFKAVKLKVGDDLDTDCARLMAARGVLADDAVVIADANGSLPLEGLDRAVSRLSDCGAQVIEQPAPGLDWIAGVAEGVRPTIALDEAEPGDGSIPAAGRVSAVCLKLQRCGGLDRLLAAAAAARRNGMSVYLGSTLEGPIGIAASVHAAAAIRPDLPSGLATLELFRETESLRWTSAGCVEVPAGCGLGIDPDGDPR